MTRQAQLWGRGGRGRDFPSLSPSPREGKGPGAEPLLEAHVRPEAESESVPTWRPLEPGEGDAASAHHRQPLSKSPQAPAARAR